MGDLDDPTTETANGYQKPHNSRIYSPLTPNEIRLFRCYKDRSGTYVGELKPFPLAKCPPFSTASYVWGEKEYSDKAVELEISTVREIKEEGTEWELCTEGGSSLRILKNFEPFLDMVTQHPDFSHKEWWWIDSICIDQSNVPERSQQVSIMEEIYKRAKRVVIWLGEEVEEGSDCRGAISFFRWMCKVSRQYEDDEIFRAEMRKEEYKERWEKVGNLLSRPWFTRVWTLQEFILPYGAKLFCGGESLSRSTFKTVMYLVWVCYGHDGTLMPRHAFDAAWNRRRIHQWYGKAKALPLVASIAYVSDHLATDPVDRIFSIRGLLSERDRGIVGAPDYSLALETVYAGLVKRFCEDYGRLDVICFSHIFNRYSGRGVLRRKDAGKREEQSRRDSSSLPSWAPDWRAHLQSSPVPLMVSQPRTPEIGNFGPLYAKTYTAEYDAPGSSLENQKLIRFSHDLRELACNGVILDVIDGLGGLEDCETRCASSQCEEIGHAMIQSSHPKNVSSNAAPATPSSRKDSFGRASCLEIVDTLSRSLVLNRKDKYLTTTAPPHFSSDLQALCFSYHYSDPALNPHFKAWYHQNQSLLIRGNPLLQIMREAFIHSHSSPSLRQSLLDTTQSTLPESDANSFVSRFEDTVRKMSRRVMVTEEGMIGMAPCRARKGDLVVVLVGCSVPVVLREVGTRTAWVVIGECYVHGWMNGEVGQEVYKGRRAVRTFRLV